MRKSSRGPSGSTKSTIVFSYPEYGSRLELTAVQNGLEGEYFTASGPVYAFEARRSAPAHRIGPVPSIEGLWTVEVPATKGESAWHLIVNQSGADVSASILRVDGDSGAVTGRYDGRTFVLGHFSGARPLRLELTPQTDGTLAVEVDDWDTYKASRAEEARAKGLPEPADPSTYSSVKDPDTPFEFSFPDIDGHVVANTDARFHRKVVIVTIGGSWCPNCHDEVPFLMELYRTYRDRGLESSYCRSRRPGNWRASSAFARSSGVIRSSSRARCRRYEIGPAEAAPAGQPQGVSDDDLPWPGWTGARGSYGICECPDRPVSPPHERRDDRHYRAPSR